MTFCWICRSIFLSALTASCALLIVYEKNDVGLLGIFFFLHKIGKLRGKWLFSQFLLKKKLYFIFWIFWPEILILQIFSPTFQIVKNFSAENNHFYCSVLQKLLGQLMMLHIGDVYNLLLLIIITSFLYVYSA